ncbi:MAG: A/G-specific adenine glycosylase [Myxococcota bacterium]
MTEVAERDAAFRAALLDWYGAHRRELPWRSDPKSYRVWVSEIMLQQTRVDTVVPYFERFTARFPTARTLAEAPLDEVLQMWQGLGYYRRARQLHAAAEQIVQRYGDATPTTAAEWQALPGVGRYTAGAIASIAHGEEAPIVDGNVARVISRTDGFDEAVDGTSGKKYLWSRAEALVRGERPGDFNQALMELGATVCKPKGARCGDCPVAPLCVAHRDERVDELPRLKEKRPPKPVALVAAVITHAASGALLLVKRKPDGLYGGMWEPPLVEGNNLAEVRAELVRAGVSRSQTLRRVAHVDHVLTHRRLSVTVAAGTRARRGRLRQKLREPYEEAAWHQPAEVALSTLARRILDSAREAERQPELW